MKRKPVFFIALLAVSSMLAMISCTEEPTPITERNTFNIPIAKAPEDGKEIPPATTTTLTWSATGGASDKWDVYFGTSESPALYKTDVTAQSLSGVPVAEGNTYYWYVKTVDALGILTHSPVFSFSVGVTPIVYDISTFTGLYDVDEGGYLYQVTLTKIDANTLQSNNFWDNAPSPLWVIQYVFDKFGNVTITPSYYKTSPTSMTVYYVEGSGTFDNTTKTLTVDYTVTKNVYTLKNDGTLTVVKSTADANTDIMTKV